MVTGGVELTQENLTSWINAGVFCRYGFQIVPWRQVAAEDWAYGFTKCKEALKLHCRSPRK